MSQAVPVVAQYGYRYEYLPSAGALGMTSSTWQPLFEERLIETIERVRPDLVVFDGTHPYRGIDAALEAVPGTRWVWSRRGMWKPGLNVDQLAKSSWFDDILEPGDFAQEYDEGASASALAHRVAPVTLVERVDLLPRAEARARLGLPAEGPIGLVALGAGNINGTTGDVGSGGGGAAAYRMWGGGHPGGHRRGGRRGRRPRNSGLSARPVLLRIRRGDRGGGIQLLPRTPPSAFPPRSLRTCGPPSTIRTPGGTPRTRAGRSGSIT